MKVQGEIEAGMVKGGLGGLDQGHYASGSGHWNGRDTEDAYWAWVTRYDAICQEWYDR
jgi:hypothetical protein